MNAPEPAPIRSDDSQLHELLVLVLDRIAEQGLSAASEILERHPEHADELRRRLRKLQAAGLLPSPEGAAEQLPERLGDFRLLRPLGSGGMGIVYLARQESLGRDVALKLVRPEQLFFAGARERFRREVEAIARLQDPGIVAIHTVGEESGIPYFAMEHVVGATLAELVVDLQGRTPADLRGGDLFAVLRQRLPAQVDADPPAEFDRAWPDLVTWLLAQVARAVAHAHAHGVLHRDLKSANVMLRPDGRAVVLDFGLAQPRGASRLTRTGAPLGTLHAMAPEQLRGEHDAIDERTDVYALGVLFYELLTLRPPFVGGSYDAVARRILDANPQLPSGVNAAVSWDCETVCLTAMEPDPARRYPSANALLRDLENLLARRSIEARRPGLMLRVRRFAERHRGVAGAVGILLLAVFVVPIVIAVRERSLNAELRQAMARAQSNVAAAAQGLNELLREVEAERLDLVPDLGEFNRRLSAEVSRQVETLLDSNPETIETRLDFAEALHRIGTVRWAMREFEAAEQLVLRATALVESLPAQLDGAIAERRDWVRMDGGLAQALLQRRHLQDGEYRAAVLDCLGRVELAMPIERRAPRFRSRYGAGLERLATMRDTPADEALALLRRCLELRLGAVRESDELTEWLEVARTHRLLAAKLRPDDASAAAQQSLEEERTLRAVAARTDGDLSVRNALARELLTLARRIGVEPGRNQDALQLMRRAVEVFVDVCRHRASRVELQVEMLSARCALARMEGEHGQWQTYRESMAEILDEVLRLAVTWPQQGGAWLLLMDGRRQLYDGLLERGEVAAAEALVPVMVAEGRRAVAASSIRATPRFALSGALAIEAGVAVRHADLDRAKQLLGESAAIEREAREAARDERVGLGQPSERVLTFAAIELAQGNRGRAIDLFVGLGERVVFDPMSRVPQLRELADEPRIAGWLNAVRQWRSR